MLFDAVLREVPGLVGGSLVRVLAMAAAVLEDPVAANRREVIEAMARFRRLVDVLADSVADV